MWATGGRVVLLSALLVAGLAGASQYNSNRQRQAYANDYDQDQTSSEDFDIDSNGPSSQEPKPFEAGQQYIYAYDGQIATGLDTNGVDKGLVEPQQKSVSRIKAEAQITFQSSNQATLRLLNVRIGQLNKHIEQPEQVQPMGMFEEKQVHEDKARQLALPLQFDYSQGLVQNVQFHIEDRTWSKNVKRSVLNLIQVNLKASSQQQQSSFEQQGSQDSKTRDFTVQETTIEGDCQTAYTINKNSGPGQNSDEQKQRKSSEEQDQRQMKTFNVTKAVNFRKCRKVADIAHGYQTEQEQQKCASVKCQQQWYKQLAESQRGAQGQQQQQEQPCDQCDPKEIKDRRLDRATVMRFTLSGQPEPNQFAIKRAELISQYVYKSLRAQNSPYSSSLQAVVTAQLVFRRSQEPKDSQQQQQQLQQVGSDGKRNTLLYDSEWDIDEKRFYMDGDDEFGRNGPFVNVPNKVEQAQQILRKLISAASDKNNGVEFDQVVHLQRLVELFRMCNVDELRQIQSIVSSSQSKSGQTTALRSESERKKAEQILADGLAIAGTRNTIFLLSDLITQNGLDTTQAFQSLKSLSGLVAPSDKQVEIVLNLCQSEAVHRSKALKQTCWLTFGSMVNELCQTEQRKNQANKNGQPQQQPSSQQQQQAFGAQSGFEPKNQMCQKKQQYKQALTEQYNRAQSTYEKVLALKALGNAGIDTTMMELERVINNKREDRIVRCTAIDALRRLRSQMPRKIQRCLLPIFQNTKEHPEVRMSAFHMIMHTQPELSTVDRCVYTLIKESNPEVQSFVYTSMKAMSKSKAFGQQHIAKHLKNTLKLVNVDEQSLRPSRKYQLPIYSDEQEEGVLVNLMTVFNSRGMLPNHMSVGVDSLLNGQYEINQIRLSATQQGIEQWYEQLMSSLFKITSERRQQQQMRARRSFSYNEENPREQIRKIRSYLNIQNRRSDKYVNKQQRQGGQKGSEEQWDESERQGNDQAFAMICMRTGDVDQAILPLDHQNAPGPLKKLLDGQQPSLREIIETLNEGKQFRILTAMNLNEKTAKIPTTIGLPLRVQQSTPLMLGIDGNAKANMENSNYDSGMGVKATVNVHVSVSLAHIQKMECWTPTAATGVVTTQAFEMNTPIQAEIKTGEGIKIALKTPQAPKTRIFGLHSLPTTYTAEWDNRMKMLREPKVRAIHNQGLEQLQRRVHTIVGEQTTGMPFQISGHYHRPARISDYKQTLQLLMATENHVHVTFEPKETTAKEVVLRIEGFAFEKTDDQKHLPELDNFYSQASQFENAYPKSENDDDSDESEEMQLDNHEQSRRKLNNFLNGYQARDMYQHSLKLTVETQGGRKEAKAEFKVRGACDAPFKYCKGFVDVKRTPMLRDETNDWQLQSKIQMLCPESVGNVQDLSQLDDKNQKFILKADTEWGANNKQQVNLRVQGQKAQTHDQERRIQDYRGPQLHYQKKRSAFINRFDMVADYKLKPDAQNVAIRAIEMLKAYHFWNSESVFGQSNGRDGQMHATMVIDPISQQLCNITLKTASQSVRIQNVELPTEMRPFPLVRQSQKPTHSTQQFLSRVAMGKRRAECSVDGKRVDTFDGVVYKAPLGKCYSVVAKDCRSSQPRFIVLMKALSDDGQEKKVKVITPERTVVCQPKKSEGKTKLQCMIDGQEIHNDNDYSDSKNQQQRQQLQQRNQDNAGQQIVEWNNQDGTDVTINVEGVSVRLGCWCNSCKCQKAWIKISNRYKEGQCGLCGHYDDQAENDLRMGNNQQTDDLADFHRSYSFRDEDCNEQDQKDVYENKKDKFKRLGMKSHLRQKKHAMDMDEMDDEQDQEWRAGHYNSEESDSSEESQSRSWSRNSRRQYPKDQQRKGKGQGKDKGVEPIPQTKVIEFNHRVCFSTQAVKQCPEGTKPADSQDEQGEQKKAQFACLPRSSPDVQRMQTQARKGVIVDMSEHSPSFVEPVTQPSRCVRY